MGGKRESFVCVLTVLQAFKQRAFERCVLPKLGEDSGGKLFFWVGGWVGG